MVKPPGVGVELHPDWSSGPPSVSWRVRTLGAFVKPRVSKEHR